MTRSRLALLLLLACLASTACVTYDRGSYAAISTVDLPLSQAVVAENVEGRVCGDLFREPVKRAMDDALQKAPGANALTHVHYGFEQLCMVVRGTAVRVE